MNSRIPASGEGAHTSLISHPTTEYKRTRKIGSTRSSFERNLIVPKGNITINRRLFYLLISSLMIMLILLPIAVYWSDQRVETHARWDNEINYAQLFRLHVDTAAYLINGTFFPWSNQSERSALDELSMSGTTLFFLGYLDSSHANQLSTIANIVLGSSSAFYQITQSRRVSFSTNLRSLGDKIVYAYFLNNTSSTPGVGPPFWYSGPSPPDERDLQDASTIAANLTG